MAPIHRTTLVLCASLLLVAAGPVKSTPGSPVMLQSNPGTKTDATARTLSAEDIAAARSRGDQPLLLTARAALGGPQPALFVQLQSPRECGSAGCSTSIFSFERGRWQRVLDSATGLLKVSAKKTRSRNDIISQDDHYVWSGTDYRSIDPAPASIDLRPHPHPRRQ
ncbi:MAG: hypothetical protein M3N26_10015 [Pseudomonadota bacterium]|nr:hypothetical protein [Pseudomonadota bacterium]